MYLIFNFVAGSKYTLVALKGCLTLYYSHLLDYVQLLLIQQQYTHSEQLFHRASVGDTVQLLRKDFILIDEMKKKKKEKKEKR